MSAKSVDKLPEGDDWLHEIKWDGRRVEAIKHPERVQLFSRKAKDQTRRVGHPARAWKI